MKHFLISILLFSTAVFADDPPITNAPTPVSIFDELYNQYTLSNPFPVTNVGTTPLPSNAATASNQLIQIAYATSSDGRLAALVSASSITNAQLASINNNTDNLESLAAIANAYAQSSDNHLASINSSFDVSLSSIASAVKQDTQIAYALSSDNSLTAIRGSSAAIQASFDVSLSSRASALNQLTQIGYALSSDNSLTAIKNSVALLQTSFDVSLSSRASALNQSTQIAWATSADTKLASIINNQGSQLAYDISADNKLASLIAYAASSDLKQATIITNQGSQIALATSSDTRLATLVSQTDTVESNQVTQIAYAASADTKDAIRNAYLVSLDAKGAISNSYSASADIKLATLISQTDGIEANQTVQISYANSADTKLATLISQTDAVEGNQVTQIAYALSGDTKLASLISGDSVRNAYLLSLDNKSATANAYAASSDGHLANIDVKTASLGQTTSLTTSSPNVQPADIQVATQNITVVDSASVSTVQANGQTVITGTPTVGSTALFTNPGYQNATVIIKGTWTGSVQVETSSDGGTTWFAHTIRQYAGSIYQAAFTANVQGNINLASQTQLRVRAATAITGTVNVSLTQSFNNESVYVANSLRIADGSNPAVTTPLTIKAGNTLVTSADTSAVVTLSPNSAPTPGFKSTANSSTAQLAAGSTFTGAGENVLAYKNIQLGINSDRPYSFRLDWSNDCATYFSDDSTYEKAANTPSKTSYGRAFQCVRPVVTNTGASTTTTFFVSTIYDVERPKPSSTRIGDPVSMESDAELVKASITGLSLTANSGNKVTVGPASTQVLAANTARKGACFGNVSALRVTFSQNGGAPVLLNGNTLNPGGYLCMNPFTFTSGVVNAISSASADVTVQEYQ